MSVVFPNAENLMLVQLYLFYFYLDTYLDSNKYCKEYVNVNKLSFVAYIFSMKLIRRKFYRKQYFCIKFFINVHIKKMYTKVNMKVNHFCKYRFSTNKPRTKEFEFYGKWKRCFNYY